MSSQLDVVRIVCFNIVSTTGYCTNLIDVAAVPLGAVDMEVQVNAERRTWLWKCGCG